jgi:hypothetical protein
MVAEAYDEARSLTQIELDLMVAAKVIRIPDCTEREMDIHDSNEGHVQAAARWRDVAEKEQVIHLQDTHGNLWGADSVLAVADDRIETDILDSIIAEGSCRACGTRWASVLGLNGDRATKIEDGCPNEVCVLGDR